MSGIFNTWVWSAPLGFYLDDGMYTLIARSWGKPTLAICIDILVVEMFNINAIYKIKQLLLTFTLISLTIQKSMYI